MTRKIHFKMDKKEKEELKRVLQNVGLTPAEAFQIFAKKVIDVGGLPFEFSEPNQRLKSAINSQDFIEFDNSEEGLKWLNG